jgi:hypothetical protein
MCLTTHLPGLPQGVPGAYSEMAALKACPGWEPLPCEQFEVAFQAISQVGGCAEATRWLVSCWSGCVPYVH